MILLTCNLLFIEPWWGLSLREPASQLKGKPAIITAPSLLTDGDKIFYVTNSETRKRKKEFIFESV